MSAVVLSSRPNIDHVSIPSLVTTVDVGDLTPPLSPQSYKPQTISELISLRAQSETDTPILGYPTHGGDYVQYTFGQIDTFVDAAASRLASTLPVRKRSTEPEVVVAILGPSSFDYLVTALALSRLGFGVLFLSTRISQAAYVSLLQSTGCSHICVDGTFEKTVAALQKQVSHLNVLSTVSYSQYGSCGHVSNDLATKTQRLDPCLESSKIAWIIHSSGSTGLPKPIYQTHGAALHNYENNMDMAGFITLPLFHAHGLSSVLRGFTSRKTIFMWNAALPLTIQGLLEVGRKCSFDVFYGVPYALKLLSESEEGIEMLKKCRVVMFGGSACPDGLGDLLVEHGVNLVSHYGTTETGQLMTSFRPAGDQAWNYVRVHDTLLPYAQFEQRGGNLFELVILKGWPSKVATNREDGSYATKDLFEPHPIIKRAWKYGGRLDDTIVLLNGEKAVPISTEMAVRQSHLVRDVVVVGSGKPCLGMVIIASEAGAALGSDVLIQQIWSAIEEQNLTAPAYAQLSREAITVLPSDTVYPQTDKGTLIRQAFYKSFATVIETIYSKLEASTSGTLVLSHDELRDWLRKRLVELVPGLDDSEITDSQDLFALGVDSLQSSRLRGAILKEIQLNGCLLSQNIVFEQPSIARLADALITARDGTVVNTVAVEDEMAQLIEKYGDFPRHVPVVETLSHLPESQIVVVTGATGSLGAHIVAQLVAREDITEVCCLVRASSSVNAMQRVLRSMHDRAVLHKLPLKARRKITAYPSDFSQNRLGLVDEIYHRLSIGITSLIHCAWSVNFNKRLSSFEADCIAGSRHLILLCLAARAPKPASFNFCSSVSTVARTAGSFVPEALPTSLQCAQNMGYAQSKLVTEHIVARAAAQTGIAARVLRVGQIIADQDHGIWNDTEAIPLMLQSATTIGALPTLDERPRWLPVDVVATSVNAIAFSTRNDVGLFFNIVNPNTFHWTEDLLLSLEVAGLDFQGVSPQDWVQRLRNSNTDVVANPTYKLLNFFAAKYDHVRTSAAGLEYGTSCVESLTAATRNCPALSQDLVARFVQHFLATSWITKPSPSAASISSHFKQISLIVLAGPSGCGKSTVAQDLAHMLGCPSIEGDSLHDAVAITKMSTGNALSSLDRQIWLARVRIAILERIRVAEILGQDAPQAIVLTCSALRREYRDALRHMLTDGRLVTRFVMLEASESELVRRLETRRGHYMKSDMVKSQLETFEQPLISESDVLPIDTQAGSSQSIAELISFVLAN